MLIEQLLMKKFGAKSADIEIHSVNGFQGREKNVIIFSSVISNEAKKLGFMSDPRRLNVTMTRARYCFFMVGNIECLAASGNAMWCNTYDWYYKNGLLYNASQFVSQYQRACEKAEAQGEKKSDE